MKALVRDNEVIPENQWTPWIIEHLKWMTTPRYEGDGYILVEDYQPEIMEETE